MVTGFYVLPKLDFDYNALAPFMSEQQLKLHYEKHHQAYINNANAILERIDKARKDGSDFDAKAVLKELSFNIGGHVLHSLFWGNIAPAGKGGAMNSSLSDAITSEFGSFERFKKEFTQAALSVEGSGWAALAFCENKLLINQIEKHSVNVYPNLKLLMVIDVWEHAYYLDYKNDRSKFIEAFWSIINWNEVSKRFDESVKN